MASLLEHLASAAGATRYHAHTGLSSRRGLNPEVTLTDGVGTRWHDDGVNITLDEDEECGALSGTLTNSDDSSTVKVSGSFACETI